MILNTSIVENARLMPRKKDGKQLPKRFVTRAKANYADSKGMATDDVTIEMMVSPSDTAGCFLMKGPKS